jgi:dTDP-glucose 4,6-dehydratase
MKKIVYVTGCLGFIGIHITQRCLDQGWYVMGIDRCNYASNLKFMEIFNKYDNFQFQHKDINDLDYLYDCDYIINTAAETHVDNSISGSDVFVHSNINGVHHLLELIKTAKERKPVLLHFSTDEVYGDTDAGSFTEECLLKPSNPYSATKAAADQLILAWSRTYDIPYVIVRPSNNYGIGQYVEKLIPRAIKCIEVGRKIPLHMQGTPRRTWLHVEDTASAIIHIIKSGSRNEIYNIAGSYECENREVVSQILELVFHKQVDLTDYCDFGIQRQGVDVRYSIDDTKLKLLGWKPEKQFAEELPTIVAYYQKNFVW